MLVAGVPSARDSFISSLRSIRDALAEEPVLRGPSQQGKGKAADVGAILRRGLAVSTFNVLENFIESRIGELVAQLNGGQLSFSDLPEGTRKRSISTTLKVAASKLQRQLEYSEVVNLGISTGVSLSSLNGVMQLSPLALTWPGSNLSESEFRNVLKFFHVKDAWRQLREVASQMGFQVVGHDGKEVDLQFQFLELARERHSAAHNSNHAVSAMVIGAHATSALLIASSFDALASRATLALKSRDPEFLARDNWTDASKISFRTVKQREKDFAEFRESSPNRASAVNKDRDTVWKAAYSRCVNGEVLIELDQAGQLVDWAYPALD